MHDLKIGQVWEYIASNNPDEGLQVKIISNNNAILVKLAPGNKNNRALSEARSWSVFKDTRLWRLVDTDVNMYAALEKILNTGIKDCDV